MTEIESQRKEPNAVARLAVARHGNPYTKGHVRYEPTFDEQIAEINGVTVDRIRAFHANFYGVDSADFAAVGDFDAATLKAQLEQLFGGWKSKTPYARVANPIYTLAPMAQKMETPDKANAFFVTLARIPLRDDDPGLPGVPRRQPHLRWRHRRHRVAAHPREGRHQLRHQQRHERELLRAAHDVDHGAPSTRRRT